MKTSTAWSLLAFSLALACYALSRDISANIFLSCFLVIQGLKRTDRSRQERKAAALAVALSVGVLLFAVLGLTGLIDLSPEPFRYKR